MQKQTKEKLGAGVIGVGTYGEWHVRAYSEFNDTNLIAIADMDEERAKKVAAKYKVKYYYKDYRELISRPDIDLVSIVLPDFLHREACICAANAGKHILVEKPLATNIEDALAIMEAVKKSGVKFMVDFANRWSPPFSYAKRAISAGKIGEVRYIYIHLNNSISVPTEMLRNWKGKSSVIWFLGSHCVDLCRWLIGSEVNAVSGISRSGLLTKIGVNTPDFYQYILEFENGSVANIENCWILPNISPTIFDFKAEIIGNKGKFTISTAEHDIIKEYSEDGFSYPDVLLFTESEGYLAGFGKEPIAHFVRSIIKNESIAAPIEDGVEGTQIIAAIEQSAREGGKKIIIRR